MRAGGHTDGQTHMTKLTVALRSFASAQKAPETLLFHCSCCLFDTFTVAFYIPRPTPSIAKLKTRHATSEVDTFGFTGILHVMPQGHAQVVFRVIRLQDKENTRQFSEVCLTLTREKQSTLLCWNRAAGPCSTQTL
jgi:hypothetical protein